MSIKPSRTVTRRKCIVCEKGFAAKRRDATYCSGACRQRAMAARKGASEIDRELAEARQHYWDLVRRKAEAEGKSASQILTAQAQFVDERGNVYMHGRNVMGGIGADRELVGRADTRPGWASWGLEAAGPPFSPPGLKRGAA